MPLSINTEDFRLDVFVFGDVYVVLLNGQRLINERLPFAENGLIGFYTLGPAVFDNLSITAAEDRTPGDMVYISDFEATTGGAGWVADGETVFAGSYSSADGFSNVRQLGGTWDIAGTAITQQAADTGDYALSLGQGSADLPGAGGTFTLRMDISGPVMTFSVNGQVVAEDVPLRRTSGWFGLLAHGGPITFDDTIIDITE